MGVGALGREWGMWVVGSVSLLCRGKGKQLGPAGRAVCNSWSLVESMTTGVFHIRPKRLTDYKPSH